MNLATDTGRETVIFGHEIDWTVAGPDVKFEGLSPSAARTLLTEGYMDPDARSGRSPTMATMVEFMERFADADPERNGTMSAHGRVIAPSEPDAQVLLEGVIYSGPTSSAFVRAYADLFYEASSFMLEKDLHARCWFE
ncbi:MULTISPECIES: hypothetical protein [unclassified Haladaptatus]|uniref:hypothetical protein n=1 Tax=unclassified Haladaptatus TaxID=2622732 RepID=UPI0023E7E3F3|nr:MULTISPECIES: hypothetical protein [unclassified Haladaptatus]